MVRTPFFEPDEASTLSKADKDATAAGKLLVEGASASGVGHSVVGTAADEAGTGASTQREVGIGAAESAVVVEVKVGTTAAKTRTGTSREVDIGAAELAADMEAEVGAAAGSAAVVEAEGGVVKSAESTSVEIPSLLPSKGL